MRVIAPTGETCLQLENWILLDYKCLKAYKLCRFVSLYVVTYTGSSESLYFDVAKVS